MQIKNAAQFQFYKDIGCIIIHLYHKILCIEFTGELTLVLRLGLKTRRMSIANGTCVSFCNQPKAHFGLRWYAPGTIAVNVTWMKRGFHACQTHRSMYPSIFNRFPVIQLVISKVCHFSTFLHILAFPGYALGQSR